MGEITQSYKTGYLFSLKTGEFLYAIKIYVEARTGNYPKARNVTFVKPPKLKEHEASVWKKEKWEIVPDYRGMARYKEDGSKDGNIEELGEVPEIKKEPPERKDHISLTWDKTLEDWVQAPEKGYTYDDKGELREMSQAEKIEAGFEDLPEGFKIEDGQVVLKTLDDKLNDGDISLQEYNEEIDRQREYRYQAETDKMGLMYLRGECSLEEWKAAMDKIRQDLPKK